VLPAAARRPVPWDLSATEEGAGLGRSSDSAEEEDPETMRPDGCTGGAIVGMNGGGSWQEEGQRGQ
jgi:hypothetical protein